MNGITVTTAEELGSVLGLSDPDVAEMEFRSEMTVALAKIIQEGKLTHAEIARRAGTSRTRVTAIANGNTQGVSTDVLIRVLAATGHRASVKAFKISSRKHHKQAAYFIFTVCLQVKNVNSDNNPPVGFICHHWRHLL